MNRSLLRLFLVALAAVGLLVAAGCGGDEKASGDKPKAPATRTVQTAMGPVKDVPAEPKRVVVLDADGLDSAVTLGVKPVGATVSEAGEPITTYLPKDSVSGIKLVGTATEPSVDEIIELSPDLILGSKARHESLYKQLSKVAPTVFTETTGPDWRDNFKIHAEALGKSDEVGAISDAYDKQISDSVAKLGGADKLNKTTVGYTRFVAGALTRLYLDDTFIGSIFVDLGVGRPSNLKPTGFSLDISPEQIDQANADVIFYSTYGDPKEAKEPQITRGPLWKNLDAVKDGRAYAVDDDLFMLGIGYSGAKLVVDQITQKLATT